MYIIRMQHNIGSNLNDMSPLFMKSLFIKKCSAYELRDFIPLIQPEFNTITYGHNTIMYQGSKIWNNLFL